MSDESADLPDPAEVDRELVRSISRWAVVVTLSVVLFDLAILWNYPFPGSSNVVRGVFYAIVGIAIALGALACTFLGYRIVTLRFVPRSKRIYVIFMPLVALLSSVAGFVLLSPVA